ncbi:MAG: class I SAM-dependent methyltransferase [Planctomycetota bacterium]|jgi:16S rRNA (guanine1516-N2)-methyltransferase
MQRTRLVVLVERTATDAARAEQLAVRLDVPLVHEPPDTAELLLAWADDVLEAREPGDRPGRGLSVRFDARDWRPGAGGLSRRQPLARAVGPGRRSVADATAGLGGDAMLLAALGHRVVAIERSSVVAALLRDGLERARDDATLARLAGDRLTLVEGEAVEVLPSLQPAPDVVYIDPMFPPRRKQSALPARPLQLLRRIVGEDHDAGALLSIARMAATQRVVVKRPTWAEPIAEGAVSSHRGKLARYDVYRPLELRA